MKTTSLILLILLSACQRGGTYPHGVFVRDLPDNPIGSLDTSRVTVRRCPNTPIGECFHVTE